MKILIYRYGSICEPDIIEAFRNAGLTVDEDCEQISDKKLLPSDIVLDVSERLKNNTYLFVFSINFFPPVSDTCELYKVPYVAWTVDSPIMELFSPSLKNSCNRIFLFDRHQYNYFGKDLNNCFYLPLATNVMRWDSVIKNASKESVDKFTSDISFVGSLYTEKNPYRKIKNLSAKTKGYIDGLLNAQKLIYGYYFAEEALNDEIMEDFLKNVPDLTESPYSKYFDPKIIMADFFLGMELACRERKELLNYISESFPVNVYTNSDTSELSPNVIAHGGVKTLSEMPLVFNGSKINLNFTIRPIRTGLSLRLFDITGSGGFLLTNFQEELPEYFEPGKDVEFFTSKEELSDKIAFYLSNDSARMKIAQNGYEKTKKLHTYGARINSMIKTIYECI